MSDLEFSRIIRIAQLADAPEKIVADEAECAALASRFGIPAIKSLEAEVSLEPKGDEVAASGHLKAKIVQSCAVSGDHFTAQISEELDFIFVRDLAEDVEPDEEIELSAEDLDKIAFDGEAMDIGEAVAQSLGLAIDPFARGPNAENARKSAGIVDENAIGGPLAEALAALKK